MNNFSKKIVLAGLIGASALCTSNNVFAKNEVKSLHMCNNGVRADLICSIETQTDDVTMLLSLTFGQPGKSDISINLNDHLQKGYRFCKLQGDSDDPKSYITFYPESKCIVIELYAIARSQLLPQNRHRVQFTFNIETGKFIGGGQVA